MLSSLQLWNSIFAKFSDQDVIQDETLPVVVHFSISEDTVCSTPPGGDHNRVYYWQAPDFLDGSLFVDFLTEIVDTISDRDTKRFLELIEPSEALWDELRKWNRKRKRWFDDYFTSLRVREVCSTFCSNGDFITLFPPEAGFGILSVDVLVNNDSDPSGELRKKIMKAIAADISFYEEFESAEETEESQAVFADDKFSSDEEEEEIDEVEEANPEKPCYYPSQIEMATILKKRIDTIMWHYHDIAKLSVAFDNVEFAVYTARYRMLSDQTEKRICHPDAGVLSKEELMSRKTWSGKKRMFMYVRSTETDMHFEQLKTEVQEKPKTLFIIIADECHWGITKDKDQKPSAHNLFINEWCRDNSPRNVVVVQISATPFNLLTQNSRLPEVRCLLLYDKVSTSQNNQYKAGDLLVLDREPEDEERLKQTSKEVELHIVHWSEVELKNFEKGMRMKLKSALITPDAPYKYLHVSSQGTLGVVSNEREATDFLVQGSQGIVTIRPILSRTGFCALTRNTNGILEAKVDPQQPAKFEVKLEFGVGVAAFSSCDKTDHYLAVDDQDLVSLQVAKIEHKCGVSIMKPKHDVARVSFQFYIEQCGPAEVNMVENQYVSLNYYLSTLNCCNKNDQKIREDKCFQRIVDSAKRQNKHPKPDSLSLKIDALLCAEYCYYILHVSAFNSDDKMQQALMNDTEGSPVDHFSEMSSSFSRQLKKSVMYINHEAFEMVQREICNTVKRGFRERLRDFSRAKRNNTPNGFVHLEEELRASFVACLMHLTREQLQMLTEETHATSVVRDIKQMLQENNCERLIEIWACAVKEYETGSLVKSLIQSGKGHSGKMKIVRAKSMETADQFYHTLRLARALSSLEECFEVIRDYGGIQIEKQLMKSSSPFFIKLQPNNCQFKFDCPCSEIKLQPGRKKCANCQHVHKTITQYEDLNDLACILILVDKGRMGDTFPQSFDCLDLRLNYDSSREFRDGSPVFLSSVIQELGRMCRYANESVRRSHVPNTPYVLVGRELFKRLEDSVKRSPAMSAVSCTRADRYMSASKSKCKTSSSLRWLDYEAHKDSYDYGNKQKHYNRILLQAEPQIGKTGTYLCLIKQLRQDIFGKEKISSTETAAFDEGSFYMHKQCDSLEETVYSSMNNDEDWQFPYWKTIENSPSLLEKAVGQGKYSIGGLFYTHDIEESPFILMKGKEQKLSKSILDYHNTSCENGARAWHWYHFENCAGCGRLLQGERPVLETCNVVMDGSPVKVTCSLPTSSLPYNHLRRHLSSIRSVKELWTEFNCPGRTSLPYWIFHPSHRVDPRKCLLNYHHVMQEEGEVTSYIQVAVVRSEKFEAYRSTWGKVLAIFQLPDELPNCELGPSEGGVGYSRLFIQKIAFALRLEYVFVIDDNVALMSEAVFRPCEEAPTGQSVVRDEKGVIKMERCSFLRPLNHLQKIANGKDNPPSERIQYEPHPLREHPEGQQFPLYTYTGPAKLFGDKPFKSYGILGLLRSVPKVARPFAKTQVYAAYLLNVKSTVDTKVFYRPWPCWEDLRFNDDCDKAGLWVVKCNRFLFYKVQYNDWIKNLVRPSIFQWNEDSTLEKRPLASELPWVTEKDIIGDYLRRLVNIKGPEKCHKGHIGYDRQEVRNDPLSPTRIIEGLNLQKYESTNDGSMGEIPVLIVSYCASVANRRAKDMMLLNSAFCAAQEKIIFIVSANDAIERWPGLTLAIIPSHNGLCLTSEMSERCGRFSIFSAADPRRHRLRWIVIETSFSKEDGMGTMMGEFNATVDRNYSEKVTNVDESILLNHQQSFSEECKKSSGQVSTTRSQESVDIGKSSELPSGIEPGVKESFSASQSPHENPHLKRETFFQEIIDEEMICQTPSTLQRHRQEYPSVKKPLHGIAVVKSSLPLLNTSRQQSPNAKPRTTEESPRKRRKIIDDYFCPKDYENRDEQSVPRSFQNEGVCGETSNGKKFKREELCIDGKGERRRKESDQGEAISENEQSKVRKRKKKELKTGSSQKSTNPIHSREEIMSRSEDDKCRASTSSLHDGGYVNVDSESNASSMTSVYSIESEDNEWPSVPETHTADEFESNDDSNTANISSRTNRDAEKMAMYMEETNAVTGVIVNLWIENKGAKRDLSEADLSKDYVQKALSRFTNDDLETKDKQGYNALLKACSLPSMSPHVLQHLIIDRLVDLNSRLPHDFVTYHRSAKGLIPGMSALSVAIRRQNTSCLSTFRRRRTEINLQDADQEGNTALHHCVVSASKVAFQKVFPLYSALPWKQMFNSKNYSPLDIARNLAQDNATKKKQAIECIVREMEGNCRDVLSLISSDEEVKCTEESYIKNLELMEHSYIQ